GEHLLVGDAVALPVVERQAEIRLAELADPVLELRGNHDAVRRAVCGNQASHLLRLSSACAARLHAQRHSTNAGFQLIFAPEALTTRIHFERWSAAQAPKSSGGPPAGRMPIAIILARTSGDLSSWFTRVLMYITTSRGVPAGPTRPLPEVDVMPGRPS